MEGPPPSVDRRKVTLIQAAIFDNGEPAPVTKKGKVKPKGKRSESRYGVAIEIWTAAPDEVKFGRGKNVAAKFSLRLKDRKGLLEDIRTMTRGDRRYPLDKAYLATLEEMAQPGGILDAPNKLIGLLRTQVKHDDRQFDTGTHFHPNQFFVVHIDGGRPSDAYLTFGTNDHDLVKLGAFDCNDASGNPLHYGIIGQSRTDLCDFSDELAHKLISRSLDSGCLTSNHISNIITK